MMAPLRRIVGHRWVVCAVDGYGVEREVMHEVLECGHTQLEKEAIYGRTNAYRRRCGQCLEVEDNLGGQKCER